MRQGLPARWLVTLLSVGVVIALQSRSGLAQVDATANAPARTLPAMPSQAQGAAQLAPPHQVAAAESAPVAPRPPVAAAPVVSVAAPVAHGTVPVTTSSAAVAPAAASASASLAPTLGATGSVTGGSIRTTFLPANVRAPTVRVVSIVVEQDTDRPIKGEFGLGGTLVVQLEPGNLAELIAQAQLERQPLGLFIWAITGAIPEITTSVLTLLGIGGATALGARILDDNKLDQRKEQDPPHTTLALMGISSGTYLGFKIPEK